MSTATMITQGFQLARALIDALRDNATASRELAAALRPPADVEGAQSMVLTHAKGGEDA